MERIGIFCSAADDIEAVYFEKARELGVWLGENKKTLVYGGANIGLMECVAQSAKKHGAFVMGVVPTKLEERGAVPEVRQVNSSSSILLSQDCFGYLRFFVFPYKL